MIKLTKRAANRRKSQGASVLILRNQTAIRQILSERASWVPWERGETSESPTPMVRSQMRAQRSRLKSPPPMTRNRLSARFTRRSLGQHRTLLTMEKEDKATKEQILSLKLWVKSRNHRPKKFKTRRKTTCTRGQFSISGTCAYSKPGACATFT